MNNCEACEENFIWKFDNTKKTILYDECVSNQGYKNCIAINSSTLKCQVCKKDYELLYDRCEKIRVPFCLDEDSILENEYPANPDYPFFGRNYFH